MRTTWTALKLFICMSALTGLLYPLAVWGGARLFLRGKAEGSMVEAGGRAAGSALVGQNFSGQQYFHPRPSAVNYDPLPSGGGNQSPASAALAAAVKQRRALYGAAAPADMLTASGSGLDPHISPEAARLQCARVAKARSAAEIDIMSLVDAMTEPRQGGFLGEARVNVLLLNLKLDGKYSK
ncbi:MAG: potassium-transporting ATPase subunit KdpC [Elusimicrobia bacterium]|nr:potassium-transporting ATPase subunit KdpC [Elusimicrobiota bacterium]